MCNECNKNNCSCNKSKEKSLLDELLTQYSHLSISVAELYKFIGTLNIKDWNNKKEYSQGDLVVYKDEDGNNFIYRAIKNSVGELPPEEDSEYWEILNAEAVVPPFHEQDPKGVASIQISQQGSDEYTKKITIVRNDGTSTEDTLNIPEVDPTPGPPGPPGSRQETRFAVSGSLVTPPPLNNSQREPVGWFLTAPSTVEKGFYVWKTSAFIKADNTLDTLWNTPIRDTGQPGEDGISDSGFKSTVFRRAVNKPATPVGGDWGVPLPTTAGWSDGVPQGDNPLWMSTRIFTRTGSHPQQDVWTEPSLASDSVDTDFEWSEREQNPGTPTTNPEYWSNSPTEESRWMAVRTKKLGVWGPWKVTKIKGEKGAKGDVGESGNNVAVVMIYRRSATAPARPSSNVTVTFSPFGVTGLTGGWTVTPPTGTSNNPIWVSAASAVSLSNTDTIAPNEWSTPSIFVRDGQDGANGTNGSDGADGIDGYNTATVMLYRRTTTSTAPPRPTNNTTYTFATGALSPAPNNGWNKFLTTDGGRFRWVIQATAISRTATDSIPASEWSAPVLMSEDGIPGTQGPALAYRNEWSPITQYRGTPQMVDFVYVGTNGYIARADAGVIPAGTPVTNTTYWDGPFPNANVIFTDYFVAISAYIDQLGVGVIRTSKTNEGERFTAGFTPTDSSDPTAIYSRHSPRGYYPSGRVGWTIAFVDGDSSINVGGQTISDAFALIFYKDESGSPIHAAFSTNLDSVAFNNTGTSYTSITLIPTNITASTINDSQVDSVLLNAQYSYLQALGHGVQTDAATYWIHGIQRYRAIQGANEYYTINTLGTGSSNWVSDGWYINFVAPSVMPPGADQGVTVVDVNLIRIVNGQLVGSGSNIRKYTSYSPPPNGSSHPVLMPGFALSRGEQSQAPLTNAFYPQSKSQVPSKPGNTYTIGMYGLNPT